MLADVASSFGAAKGLAKRPSRAAAIRETALAINTGACVGMRSGCRAAFIACCLAVSALLVPGGVLGETVLRSTGQRLYVPIYSSLAYLEGQPLNFAVTVSIRNIDPGQPIEVTDVQYYGNQGEPHPDLFAPLGTLGPLASAEITIPQSELQGDTGANLIVAWRAAAPVSPPLVEAVMVGSSRAQGFAFNSRAVVLDELR